MGTPSKTVLVLLTCLSGPAFASASIIGIYNDRSEWENAVAGPSLVEDFADSILNTGLSYTSSESGHINPSAEAYQDVLASESGNAPDHMELHARHLRVRWLLDARWTGRLRQQPAGPHRGRVALCWQHSQQLWRRVLGIPRG